MYFCSILFSGDTPVHCIVITCIVQYILGEYIVQGIVVKNIVSCIVVYFKDEKKSVEQALTRICLRPKKLTGTRPLCYKYIQSTVFVM